MSNVVWQKGLKSFDKKDSRFLKRTQVIDKKDSTRKENTKLWAKLGMAQNYDTLTAFIRYVYISVKTTLYIPI